MRSPSWSILRALKEEDVDRDVFVVEVGDDPFGRGVQLGGAEDDLVRLVESFLIQFGAEAILEGLVQRFVAGIIAVDFADLIGLQFLHPAGVSMKPSFAAFHRSISLSLLASLASILRKV